MEETTWTKRFVSCGTMIVEAITIDAHQVQYWILKNKAPRFLNYHSVSVEPELIVGSEKKEEKHILNEIIKFSRSS
jgi:hypothetical protein